MHHIYFLISEYLNFREKQVFISSSVHLRYLEDIVDLSIVKDHTLFFTIPKSQIGKLVGKNITLQVTEFKGVFATKKIGLSWYILDVSITWSLIQKMDLNFPNFFFGIFSDDIKVYIKKVYPNHIFFEDKTLCIKLLM